MIAVERLVRTVCHKQWLLQRSQQIYFLDIGTGIMDEYTGLHIAVWIDMAVVSAACDTSAHIFSIVLEIEVFRPSWHGFHEYGDTYILSGPDLRAIR